MPIWEFRQAIKSGLRPEVPPAVTVDPAFREIMMACWHTDPMERPSATQVTISLRALAAKMPLPIERQWMGRRTVNHSVSLESSM